MSDGRVSSIDDLLDRAVAAINRGDRKAASALAEQVLAVDEDNADAEDLLATPRRCRRDPAIDDLVRGFGGFDRVVEAGGA